MPEIVYAQRAYGGTRLGTCDGTDRGLYGCDLSVNAMILTHYADAHPDWQVDPAQLDEILTLRTLRGEPGGYVGGCDCYPGMLHDLHAEIVFEGRRDYSTVPADLSQLAMDLEQERVLELDGYWLGLGYPTHYVRDWSWDGSTLQVANPWTGTVESHDAAWAARAITAIETYRLPGFRPSWAPAAPAGDTFSGQAVGGAHVRAWPALDAAIVRDIADAGEPVTVVATTHGGTAIPDDFGGPDTNEWFQLSDGWIASAVVKGEPPAGWQHEVAFPSPPSPPAPPDPPPPPVSPPQPATQVIPPDLTGVSVWETSPTYGGPADYKALASLGIGSVFVRAANGDGSGTADHTFVESWAARAPAAQAASVVPVAWTSWYGPGSGPWGGVTGDVATYLDGCAHYTASLQLDTPAWIVDCENVDMPGLGEALATLSALTAKPVFLCHPGDPVTYGLRWSWGPIVAAVAGLMPQLYSAAWTTMTVDTALQELQAAGATAPLLPAFDQNALDPAKQLGADAHGSGYVGCSYWYWSADSANVVSAYLSGWTGSLPPIAPVQDYPEPPEELWPWLKDLIRWLQTT